MLISDDTFEPGARNIPPALLPGGDLSSIVFFDIETTGLSWRTSHLYLIGAAWMDGSVWHIRQWFLQKPSEEPELLDQFSDFLKGFSRSSITTARLSTCPTSAISTAFTGGAAHWTPRRARICTGSCIPSGSCSPSLP